MHTNQTKGENIYKIWMDDYSGGQSKSLEKYLKFVMKQMNKVNFNNRVITNKFKFTISKNNPLLFPIVNKAIKYIQKKIPK